MEKQQLIRYAVLLIVGFALGAYLTFHTKELFMRPTIVEAPVEQKAETPAENKLFAFFSTFTQDKDTGTANIEFMYPEAGLLLLRYPTSQETGSYAVYNYKKDILLKDIGGNYYLDGADIPVAFIGIDKVLIYEQRPTINGDEWANFQLSIRDFNNSVIKTIPLTAKIQEVYPKYGTPIYIRVGKDPKTTKTYILNTETFELTEQGPPKG